jgi:uncharacterized membrane protein
MQLVNIIAHLKEKLGYRIYVLIAVLIYTIVFSIIEILIYQSYRIFTWDLGIFNQAFWNTLHGRFLYYTSEIGVYTKSGCFLAAHFSPTILLALPFYAIYPAGETLLVISTLIIAIGAFPIYEIANLFLKDERISTIIGIMYMFYPLLQGITLSGFSPESFAVTFFAYILYYLIKTDVKKLAVTLILGLMTHEASALTIAAIGVYGLLYYRTSRSKGFKVSLIILTVSIPYFFFANYMRMFFGWTGRPSLWREWAIIGAKSISDLPLKVILNPVGALNALATDWVMKLLYLALLMLPVLFIPLLGFKGLIPAIPYLLASLFSTYRLYYSLEGHYGAFVVPFVFLGFVHGLVKAQEKKFLASKLAILAFITTIIIFSSMLPVVYSQYRAFDLSDKHNSIVRSFISRIPGNASVLTQSNIFPHVSNRYNAYTIAPPTWNYEYMLIDKEILANLSKQDIEYVLLDFKADQPYSISASFIYIEFIFKNINRYSLIDASDGVVLFRLNE